LQPAGACTVVPYGGFQIPVSEAQPVSPFPGTYVFIQPTAVPLCRGPPEFSYLFGVVSPDFIDFS